MYTRISRSVGRSYLQLVEAYRDDVGRACQRTVANLGRIDQLQNGALDPIIRGLQRVASQSPPVPARIPKSGPECTPEFTTARAFGDLYALHQLWHELGLGVALRRCFRSPRRQFDAEALVRAMDVLVDHMDAVESVVCQQVCPLIDQSISIMFYDMTTIRISSETDDSSSDEIALRAFGLSKDGGIRRQFVVGVVQSADGIPLLHTTAPGNVSEVSTLRPMLEHALKRFDMRQSLLWRTAAC